MLLAPFLWIFVNSIKKSLTICLWQDSEIHSCNRLRPAGGIYFPAVCGHDADG